MMQLLCNGVYLDLPDSSGMQFTHKNPLFAFDNLECERTTQFKLPSTPTNDKVFALARIPAYDGAGMRQRFQAQAIDGTVVKNGYLYVSAYDGKDYTAVFVTGELLGLQTIRNLGTLEEICDYNDVAVLGGAPSSPASGVGTLWKNVNYVHDSSMKLYPSIELKSLYDDICTAQGITAQALPAGADGVRIIPNKLSGLKEQSVSWRSDTVGNMSQSDYVLVQNASISIPEIFVYEEAKIAYREEYNMQITLYYGKIGQFQCKQEITIKFPTNWNDDLYVGYFIDGGTPLLGEFQFYGNRYFDEDGNDHGDSLAGRTITIPQDGRFCIIDKMFYYKGGASGNRTLEGWFDRYAVSISRSVSMSGKVETNGAWVRVQDNLPNVNFVELVKTIAALSGTILNYSTASGLTYETLTFSSYPVHEGAKISKESEVVRSFSDYQQHNIVEFSDEKADKLVNDYTIVNDNLSDEKMLLQMKFSEGDNQAGLIYVYPDGDYPFLGIDGGQNSLSRIAIPKNSGLQTLCTASTQFKVEARMTLMEYQAISANTLLLIDGIKYIWTERSWQKNVAKFTLAKI